MTKTFMSRQPIILDIPDPPRPQLKFVYNFWTPDEKTRDDGQYIRRGELQINPALAPGINEKLQKALGLSDGAPTQSDTDKFKQIPRLVHVSFDGVTVGTPPDWTGQPGVLDNTTTLTDIYKTDSHIQSEASITSFMYETMDFQDSTLASRMRENLKFAINMRIAPENQVGSPSDFAAHLDSVTSNSTDALMILEAITDLFNSDPNVGASLSYVNEVGDQIESNFLAKQTSEIFSLSVHKNFHADIARHAASSPFCPYKKVILLGNTPAKALYHLDAAQTSNRLTTTSDINIAEDYNPCIIAQEIVNFYVNDDGSSMYGGQMFEEEMEPQTTLMGYIVEKTEITAHGNRKKPTNTPGSEGEIGPEALIYDHDRTVGAASNLAVNVFDNKIKYGKLYAYSVRSVYHFRMGIEIGVPPEGTPGVPGPGMYLLTAFIKSRPSPEALIKCDEVVAPEPPSGLTFDYDYLNNALLISWQFPTNSQDDVKKFQLFRRKTIMEPFTLVTEYNFDTSDPPTPSTENPHRKNIRFVSWAQNVHIDYDFGRKSNYIYAVCCVDAHAFTSKYSSQFRVKFDRDTNKIKVTTVSRPGAPKQYPNFFISPNETDDWKGLFADTDPRELESFDVSRSLRVTDDAMRDSNHSHMRVYFDPEYLRIGSQHSATAQNASGTDPHDIQFIHAITEGQEKGPVYKINIINVDRQKGATAAIQIKDNLGYTGTSGDPAVDNV